MNIPIPCIICGKKITEYKKINTIYCDECRAIVKDLQTRSSINNRKNKYDNKLL